MQRGILLAAIVGEALRSEALSGSVVSKQALHQLAFLKACFAPGLLD